MLISTLLVLLIVAVIYAEVARIGQPPHGVNPTLYSAKEDPIIQLDENTFNDTVFCHGDIHKCTAFVVEFYSDWCAHCRSYAPLYKSLAKDIQRWHKVVKVGAMNCADPLNEMTCRANGVLFFPFIKYYPRNTTNPLNASKLRPLQTLTEMRDQVTQAILGDYATNKFPDWPQFDFLGDVNTYGELWAGTPLSVSIMAIVFESGPESLIGAQLLLDLTKYSDRVTGRRCLKSHPLVDALHITDFPTMAVYKRGERGPAFTVELRRLLFSELEIFLDKNNQQTTKSFMTSNANRSSISCELYPEICRSRYYVSELDMLKAIRYALYREVARTGSSLNGANLTALYNFLSALAESFPRTTTLNSINETKQTQPLRQSDLAIEVFKFLRDFLNERGLNSSIAIEEYQREFLRAEEHNNRPFPINEEWEHCKGSNPQFRGYTCGLWTTFHALTVQSYKDGHNDASYEPLPPLHAVRGWVDQFFGCRHCRDHFIRMTTRTFPMDSLVRKADDVFLYLWKAHNIVNARLKGRDTEDPEFRKYQFPAPFLCPFCSENGQFNETQTKQFLLDYYSAIMPFRKIQTD
ncbi:Sulfhydryl oxidase 2 [Toxocara canis]|uniref:Sulfhydryl oxidase n=1 Tax=Toxocara canis TaxID=6265 RepID=A0A0B2UPA0_TOXCA|nr:Sulfhydryl oxidase 2 [Toxocara canis]